MKVVFAISKQPATFLRRKTPAQPKAKTPKPTPAGLQINLRIKITDSK
jgi:hypothetical protein